MWNTRGIALELPQMQRLVRVLACLALAACFDFAAQAEITFSQSSPSVEVYDFVEIAIHADSPGVQSPFTEATVTGTFRKAGSSERLQVDGFCDSSDGTLFRIRFMPSSAGDYTYSVAYSAHGAQKRYDGKFQATSGH